MPSFVDSLEHSNLEPTPERNTASSSHLTKRCWDAASAQRFLVSVLSTIFYARGSFPDECFRAVPEWSWNWKLSHHKLLSTGKSLSPGTRDNVLGQDGPLIYFKDSGNKRLDRFLHILAGRIFPAVEHKRLGKILLCYSRSKTKDPDALIELYSLKFRYTDSGSMYIYVSCGGAPDTPIPSCENPFTEFLRARAPLDCDFYTHHYFYSVDGKDLDEKQSHGLRDQVRAIVLKLQGKEETRTRRIGTLVYHSLVEVSERKKTILAEDEAHHLELIGRSTYVAGERNQSDQVQTPWRNISTDSPGWLSPAWITEPSRSNTVDDCNLSLFEEPSEELPPTQTLSSQSIAKRLSMGIGTSQAATFRRQLPTFSNVNADSDDLEAEDEAQNLPKRLKKNSTSYLKSSTDPHTHLRASPLVPLSPDTAGFRSTSPP